MRYLCSLKQGNPHRPFQLTFDVQQIACRPILPTFLPHVLGIQKANLARTSALLKRFFQFGGQ
jgi:hypothetical protein